MGESDQTISTSVSHPNTLTVLQSPSPAAPATTSQTGAVSVNSSEATTPASSPSNSSPLPQGTSELPNTPPAIVSSNVEITAAEVSLSSPVTDSVPPVTPNTPPATVSSNVEVTAAEVPLSSPVTDSVPPVTASQNALVRPDNVLMCTRAKAGVVEPRLHPTLLAHSEPKSTKTALSNPTCLAAMKAEYGFDEEWHMNCY